MSQQSTPPDSPHRRPSADPWQGFGYLVAGVGVYGLLGWLADRWLGTSFLVAVGIVVGAGLGLWLTIVRFTGPPPPGKGPDT
jgi:ATP synthase protein I